MSNLASRRALRALLLMFWMAAAFAADDPASLEGRLNETMRRSFSNATPEE